MTEEERRGHGLVPNAETEAVLWFFNSPKAEELVETLIQTVEATVGESPTQAVTERVAEVLALAMRLSENWSPFVATMKATAGIVVFDDAKVRWDLISLHLVARRQLRATIVETLNEIRRQLPDAQKEKLEAEKPHVGIRVEPEDHGFNVRGEVDGEPACLVCAGAIEADSYRGCSVISAPDPGAEEGPVIALHICEGCRRATGLRSSSGDGGES